MDECRSEGNEAGNACIYACLTLFGSGEVMEGFVRIPGGQVPHRVQYQDRSHEEGKVHGRWSYD